MKKTIVLALALSMALAVAGCAKTGEPAATAASEAVSTTAETAQEESTPAAAVEETQRWLRRSPQTAQTPLPGL